jgi:hypothetical protein
LIAFHQPASWPLKATAFPAGAPSPSLPPIRAELVAPSRAGYAGRQIHGGRPGSAPAPSQPVRCRSTEPFPGCFVKPP